MKQLSDYAIQKIVDEPSYEAQMRHAANWLRHKGLFQLGRFHLRRMPVVISPEYALQLASYLESGADAIEQREERK